MNILNALKQLRDDIKTWVTNNFNALNAKIDEKTIPIDSELSSTSTNPVQNKVIKKAIDNIPTFSGDYNDLTNAPDISEDGSGNMIIADESGNIIFKADADGIHTTAVSINGEAAATEKYVDDAIIKIPTPDVSGQIEAHNKSTTAHEDIRQEIADAKEELSESIVAESNEWKVVDEAGNIIFSVDESGAHTTELTLNGEVVATEAYVDNAIHEHNIDPESHADIRKAIKDVSNLVGTTPVSDQIDTAIADFIEQDPAALEALQELSQALEEHEDAYDALLETVGGKATKTELEDMKAELSESIVSETNEFHIVDNNGNIVASIDGNGVTTTTVTAQSIIVNGDNVEEHIDNAAIHVTAAEKQIWNNKSDFSGSYNDLADKPDMSNYYTKTEVDDAIDNIDIPETDLTNYYTKTETDTAIESAKEELSESIVSESEEWHVADNDGNIILSANASGLHTTAVNTEAINGVDVHYLAEGTHTFIGNVDFSEANVTGLPNNEVDTSKLVDLISAQTISGQKTFSNAINLSNSGYSGGVSWNYTAQETFLTSAENGVNAGAFTIKNNGRLYVAPVSSSASSELIVAKTGAGNTSYGHGAIVRTSYNGTPTSLTLPSTAGILATQEWVEEQGYGSGGSIDTSNLITLDGINQNLSGSILFNTNFGANSPLIVSYTNSTTGVPAIAIKTDGIKVYYPQAVNGVYDSTWSAFLKFPTDMEKSSDSILATRDWVQAQGYGSGGSSSGPLAIQVSELPTENIDSSKIYIVAENPQVYLKAGTDVITLESILQSVGVTNPVVNYYIVSTLPTEGEATDFVTMTPMHCYINSSDGKAYFYGNLGAGNMWVNAGALLAQMTGATAEDAGRTYNIYNELADTTMRIYTYWEDVQYVYTINNQWYKVNYSDAFVPDTDYTFTGHNTFEGITELKNRIFIGDVDHGRSGTVSFHTENVTFNGGDVIFNNGEYGGNGKVQYNGLVDFTYATITGLSGESIENLETLIQEKVEEYVNQVLLGGEW